VSTTDAFLAPLVTEVLLTALARLRTEGPPAPLLIGSPWLSDVPLFPGIFAGSFPFLLPGIEPTDVASIGRFVGTWVRNGGEALILVQSYDPADWPRKTAAHYNDQELDLLRRCIDSGAEVLIARGFHDKFLVVPDVVISGSANVTYSGLYLNRERLSLHNHSSAPHDYATARTACENQVATARAAGRCAPPRNAVGLADARSISEIRRCYSASWT
jgi:phosphatidylserine/phosphatidylglycerophosphate/cardiolipin synthase-like enzyme